MKRDRGEGESSIVIADNDQFTGREARTGRCRLIEDQPVARVDREKVVGLDIRTPPQQTKVESRRRIRMMRAGTMRLTGVSSYAVMVGVVVIWHRSTLDRYCAVVIEGIISGRMMASATPTTIDVITVVITTSAMYHQIGASPNPARLFTTTERPMT